MYTLNIIRKCLSVTFGCSTGHHTTQPSSVRPRGAGAIEDLLAWVVAAPSASRTDSCRPCPRRLCAESSRAAICDSLAVAGAAFAASSLSSSSSCLKFQNNYV